MGIASDSIAASKAFRPSTAGVLLGEPLRTESPLRSSPEHRLLIALLEDAIRCFDNIDDRRLALEAEEWLMEDGNRGPFSFDSVCFFLGLDPGSVRVQLRHRRFRQDPERRAG